MNKMWELLQIYAIEIIKMQELFFERSGSNKARIELMAANLVLIIFLTILVVVMIRNKSHARKKRRMVRIFYGEDSRNVMKNDMKEGVGFALKCIGFILTFWIIIDVTLYRMFYVIIYSGIECFTKSQIWEYLLKVFGGYVAANIFGLIFSIIRSRILGEKIRKPYRLIGEALFTLIAILIVKCITNTLKFYLWIIHIMNVYIIWQRIYFLICDWIMLKYNNYKKQHRKKGVVK